MPPAPGGQDTPPAQPRRPRWPLWAAVAGLLVLHCALAVGSKVRESVTTDELAHVTGGLSYWKCNDYRLQPENGVLPQRWEAIPAWLSGTPFPDLNRDDWRRSDVWSVGYRLFYGAGRDPVSLLLGARMMAVLFSAALGLLVFLWSRRLFGAAGGLLSLAFFALSPDFLAHGALATSDVCLTLLLLASAGAWWRHLHDGRLRWTVASAAAFGLVWVAKFSAVTLPPMLVLLALARVVSAQPMRLLGRTAVTAAGRIRLILLSATLHAGAAFLTIWAFFGFRYPAFNPALPAASQFMDPWSEMAPGLGVAGPWIHALMRLHALPEAWLYGLSYVIGTSGMRAAFLNGHYSLYGWRSFFLWTFALKTTPALLCALAAALGLVLNRWLRPGPAPSPSPWRGDLYRLAPLLVLLATYGAFAVSSHLDIGHRHILPLYPPLFIGIGALAVWLRARRRVAVLALGALIAWQAAACASVAPHFLAYFNAFAGGPDGGRHHLADSSLDWGQDLPGLRTWLDAHQRPGEPAYLAYFGSGEPDAYGLAVRRLSLVNGFHRFEPFEPMEPGLYCIGVTMLDQVYSSARGPWTAEKEAVYQKGRRFEGLFQAFTESAREGNSRRAGASHGAGMPRVDPLDQLSPADWGRLIQEYNAYRLARLCAYLRVRRPDATVGWSIEIYRLSAAEIAAATAADLPTLEKLIRDTEAANGTPPF